MPSDPPKASSSSITLFQSRVYHLLTQIAPGRVTTYGNLASALNTSPRAIGNALRNNPFAPQIPCHRCVSSTGYVNGYDGEVIRKSTFRQTVGGSVEGASTQSKAKGVKARAAAKKQGAATVPPSGINLEVKIGLLRREVVLFNGPWELEGDGLNIVWRQGVRSGESSGPTHPGMDGLDDDDIRNQIHFARVFGSAQDFGLGSRKDYVYAKAWRLGDNGFHIVDIYAFKNVGSGATKIKADNRYCNMMGHDDGRMDYVWILSKGDMRLFPNKGLGPDQFTADGPSYWGPNKIIFDPMSEFGRGLDRRDLHVADFNGDGACDIIWTDPDNNNAVNVFINRIKEMGDFTWHHIVVGGGLECAEKRGIGPFDTPVHFADITGNGRVDYLCEWMNQIKFSEDRDRANLQWADVNCDGMADLIWTDKFTGDGTVWYNRGRRDIGGSRFHWVNVGQRYSGSVAGSCTYYPDLSGDGYADMHSITHSIDNTATTYYNGCSGRDNVGDDSGEVEDPDLPDRPGDGDLLVNFDVSCSENMVRHIRVEFEFAREMARAAAQRPTEDGYYTSLFSPGVRADGFQSKARELFERAGSLLSGSGQTVFVTCHADALMCQTEEKNVLVAMDRAHTRLNFCPEFLTHPQVTTTQEKLDQCDIINLRQGHRTRSAIILHAVIHTSYVMSGDSAGGQEAEDYAHGYWASISLAAGTFDRGCTSYGQAANIAETPLCRSLDTNSEGICSADMSAFNVNSWTFLAEYHSTRCRVGSNNYGALLRQQLTGQGMTSSIDPCSGDTTAGLNNKVVNWIDGNPRDTNLITLSVGGNDVFFSKLVKKCIITMLAPVVSKSKYRSECIEVQNQARAHMQSNHADGLRALLQNSYLRLIRNAHPDAQLYVTGYVGFFNQDTTDCDRTSFWFEGPSWDTNLSSWKTYLTRDLRAELNGLVRQLNTVISQTIEAANTELGRERIHFVDLQEAFNGDRWCEPAIREPDPDGASYFFLPRWKDVAGASGATVYSRDLEIGADIQELFDHGRLPLPDAANCENSLGPNPDPYEEFMCEVAVGIAEYPDSDIAKLVERANYDIEARNLESRDIPWFAPLTTVKMFHPRTAGMGLYRDAVLAKIREVRQFPGLI
ncbi:hypothetical protein BJX70DRAFT_399210 [Aspergillus crustosus]